MKRVNLDEEFEKFKEKFCEIHELEQAWQNYQQEEGLYDNTATFPSKKRKVKK